MLRVTCLQTTPGAKDAKHNLTLKRKKKLVIYRQEASLVRFISLDYSSSERFLFARSLILSPPWGRMETSKGNELSYILSLTDLKEQDCQFITNTFAAPCSSKPQS